MINFFRQIRQTLIMENKTSKYLKYAIGEILLVVVGILIALQINNYKEQKKLEQLEKVYLERLLNDLDHDLSNIKEVNTGILENQEIIKNFISIINQPKERDSLQKSITSYFENGWLIFEFIPSRNTYTDLSQTGNMKVITNPDLVNDIISYYGYIAQVENSNNVNKDWITPIDQVVARETPAFQLDPTTRDLFSDKKGLAYDKLMVHKELFERDAAGHYWINESLKGNLLAIKGLTEDLKQFIQTELKK